MNHNPSGLPQPRASSPIGLNRSDRERESVRLQRSEIASRISDIAADISELKALSTLLPSGTTRMAFWLQMAISNKEVELRTRARVLADGLKPAPKPNVKRQRKA